MIEDQASRPKFTPYDVVRVINRPDITSAVVIDYSYEWADSECTISQIAYSVYIGEEQTLKALASEIQILGRLEPPLHDDEFVQVFPKNPEYAYIVGRQGVIRGNSWDPVTEKWGFAVAVQDDEVWSFMEDELERVVHIS